MSIHAGPFTRRRANRRARANLRARARRQGRAWDDTLGGIVGEQHGGPVAIPAAQRLTVRTHRPERSRTVATEYYLRIDPEDEELPEGSEGIDGESTPVTRTGRRLAAGTLREYDPEAPDDDE